MLVIKTIINPAPKSGIFHIFALNNNTIMKKTILSIAIIVTALLFGCSEPQPLTIYMVGDSTMADRYDTVETPERGWGQVFPTFLSEQALVKNHAKNGRSTKSYLDEGRWEKVMETLDKGDVVIIQFGTNDAKIEDPALFADPQHYAQNLTFMIRQAKTVGALPILCTPIARRHFNGDELQYVHGDYPAAAIEVAEKEDVPLVDMTTITMRWLEPLGEKGSRPYFVYKINPGEYSKYPDGKSDNTHLREKGALKVAELFSHAVIKQNIKPLKDYIQSNNKVIKYTIPCGIE